MQIKNPICAVTCDMLKKDYHDIIMIECLNGKARCMMYDVSEAMYGDKIRPITYDISLKSALSVIHTLSTLHFVEGTDRLSIYEKDTHRCVTYMRFILPSSLIQIDYEDESVNIDVSEDVSDFVGNLMKVC